MLVGKCYGKAPQSLSVGKSYYLINKMRLKLSISTQAAKERPRISLKISDRSFFLFVCFGFHLAAEVFFTTATLKKKKASGIVFM